MLRRLNAEMHRSIGSCRRIAAILRGYAHYIHCAAQTFIVRFFIGCISSLMLACTGRALAGDRYIGLKRRLITKPNGGENNRLNVRQRASLRTRYLTVCCDVRRTAIISGTKSDYSKAIAAKHLTCSVYFTALASFVCFFGRIQFNS